MNLAPRTLEAPGTMTVKRTAVNGSFLYHVIVYGEDDHVSCLVQDPRAVAVLARSFGVTTITVQARAHGIGPLMGELHAEMMHNKTITSLSCEEP